jgi:hypothetical protein
MIGRGYVPGNVVFTPLRWVGHYTVQGSVQPVENWSGRQINFFDYFLKVI